MNVVVIEFMNESHTWEKYDVYDMTRPVGVVLSAWEAALEAHPDRQWRLVEHQLVETRHVVRRYP